MKMLNEDVFAMMKKLMGSKVPHDICMLNGLLVLNAHELLSEVVELREVLKAAEAVAAAASPRPEPSEEPTKGGELSRGVASEPAQPLATITHPAGVSEPKVVPSFKECFKCKKVIECPIGQTLEFGLEVDYGTHSEPRWFCNAECAHGSSEQAYQDLKKATGNFTHGVGPGAAEPKPLEREFDTQKLIEDAQGRMQAAWERGFIDGYLSGPCDSSKYLQTDLQFAYEFGHAAGTKSKEGREIRFYGGSPSGVKA